MFRPTKPIVLVGPMGVGKTTIGKKLAKSLDVNFLDTDVMVVNEHGAIANIFAEVGEEKFRTFEEAAIEEASNKVAVIASGGGAVLSEKTRQLLKTKATVIYLSTDGRHMLSRLANGNRPLLVNGLDSWREIYELRKPLYEDVADFTVETSNKPLSAIIQEIREMLGADV